MYVIQCTQGSKRGLYVKAAKGQKTPYTNRIEYAEKFISYSAALAMCCPDNERPVKLSR